MCHSHHNLKISERSACNFLSYLADTQTDRQTDKVWQKHYLLGEGNNQCSYTDKLFANEESTYCVCIWGVTYFSVWGISRKDLSVKTLFQILPAPEYVGDSVKTVSDTQLRLHQTLLLANFLAKPLCLCRSYRSSHNTDVNRSFWTSNSTPYIYSIYSKSAWAVCTAGRRRCAVRRAWRQGCPASGTSTEVSRCLLNVDDRHRIDKRARSRTCLLYTSPSPRD